jgi:hypothetical protein
MSKHLNTLALAIACSAVALLACSPGMVLQGLVGGSPTTATPPQAIAQVPTVVASATLVPTANPPLSSPTAGLTSTPNISKTATAVPTGTPAPVLPLRTDLPALALRDWPRPANDNGFCIHFIPTGYYTARDFEIQIPRLKGLQMRWVLALYSDENQLRLAAPQFKAAGIVPVWRKMMSPFQRYYAWDRDIQILKDNGLPPYFQIYNEPDTGQEWGGRDINREEWVANFVQTAKDVYNAGGYVGIQVLDEEWLRVVLQTIKSQKGEKMFGRMFFVPHPYGANHPPNWTTDDVGVLGYRTFADVFQKEIGFVPPFIAGEGGWKFGAGEDHTFPPIDDKLHAQYHVELFNWFRLGKVSDGQPLPDYLFAFCPWILSAPMEGAAWYDSFEGNRDLTISEMKKIPVFTRKFSWDKK